MMAASETARNGARIGAWWIVGAFLMFVLMAVVVPFALYLDRVLADPSEWLEVRSLNVENAVEGEIPRAHIDRTVHQDILTVRHATVMKQNPETGGYWQFCARTMDRDYMKGQELPPYELTLAFWMDIPPGVDCPPMDAGTYILRVSWRGHPPGYPTKTIGPIASPPFTIHPRVIE